MSNLSSNPAAQTTGMAPTSASSRTGWILLVFFATAVGIFSLRYSLPTVPLPSGLPNFLTRRAWLITHAVSASIALLTGPWQFLPLIRQRWLTAHRWIGRVYCAGVLVGWISSLPIAAHAAFGPISSAGFLMLGAAWISATTLGYLTARQRRWVIHREWMIRSYALTAAAITLRLYMPALIVVGVPFPITYRIVAWACWIPNLFLAEWLIRHPADHLSASETPFADHHTLHHPNPTPGHDGDNSPGML